MSDRCGATKGDWVCDYPKGHEQDESRHYHDRYFHHHTQPSDDSGYFPPGSVAVEWKVTDAPDAPA